MRDRYALFEDGRVVAVSDMTEHQLHDYKTCSLEMCSGDCTLDDILLRLEVELIARANGWPTKRTE